MSLNIFPLSELELVCRSFLIFDDKIMLVMSEIDFKVALSDFLKPEREAQVGLTCQIKEHIKKYLKDKHGYDCGSEQALKIDFLTVEQGKGNKSKNIYFWLAVEFVGLQDDKAEKLLPLVKIVNMFDFKFPAGVMAEILPENVWRYFIEYHRTIQPFFIPPMDGDEIRILSKRGKQPLVCLNCEENNQGIYVVKGDVTNNGIARCVNCDFPIIPYTGIMEGFVWQKIN